MDSSATVEVVFFLFCQHVTPLSFSSSCVFHTTDTRFSLALTGYFRNILPGTGTRAYSAKGLLLFVPWGSIPTALNAVFLGLLAVKSGPSWGSAAEAVEEYLMRACVLCVV